MADKPKISGDRVRYAKTLTSIEEIRANPSAALPTSLKLRRAGRTGSANEGKLSQPPAVIAMLLIGALLIPTALALSSGKNKQVETESEKNSGVVGVQNNTLGKSTSAEAAFIIQKVLDRYAAIKTYSAIGELLTDVDTPLEAMEVMPGMTPEMLQQLGERQLKSIFTVKMAKPNFYCIEWNKNMNTNLSKVGNAWSVGNGSYGLILGEEKSFEKPLTALIWTANNMGRVQSSLFFDTSLNVLRELRDLSQQEDEQLEGVDCYVISGSRHRVTYTYWVSKKDFLIRRYKYVSGGDGKPIEGGEPELTDETIKESLKAMDKEATPEEIAKMRAMLTAANAMASKVKVTNTETYSNIILDQPISKEQFVPSKDIDEITEKLKNLRAKYIHRLKNISPTEPNLKSAMQVEGESKGSKLEFRVLPDSVHSSRVPSPLRRLENEMKYRKHLRENGPDVGHRRGDDYIWLEVEKYEPTKFSLLVIEKIDGKSYVLAANVKNKMMLADGTWGLQRVYPEKDRMGRPVVGFDFDKKGGEIFYELSKTNLEQVFAIIIDGKIVSAPRIMAPLQDKGVIVSDFTQEEVERMVEALRKGMPAVDLARQIEGEVSEARRRTDAAKWSEGKTIMGTIAVAIRAWVVEHRIAGNWDDTTLTLKRLGFMPGDLRGNYFNEDHFSWTVSFDTANNELRFTITGIAPAGIKKPALVTLKQDGTWHVE
jgi:hypothetical protein